MPKEGREPQSYGSNEDWTSGRTGENVNDPKATPPPQHADFYDDRRESENSLGVQGGRVSPVQLEENVEPSGFKSEAFDPVVKVTTRESGAKRDSYFKKRDY